MQLLKDFGLRLRSERKTQVITGVVALCLLFLFFGDSGGGRRMRQQKPVQVGGPDVNERWTDLIERFNGQLNQLAGQTQGLREDVDANKKAMQDYEATTAEIFKKILERLQEVQNAQNITTTTGGPKNLEDINAQDLGAVGPDELETLGPIEPVAVQPPPQPVKPKLVAVMPGDTVRVKLLAGVNAPTDGTPYPVVMKLISDVSGPDGNSVPLGEARLIAAAQGSLTDHRVLLRLTRLSLRMPNGRRKEFPVDGWVVGEDGIRGLEGVLIDPLGPAIAGTAATGFLQGIGTGVQVANTVNRQGFYGQSSYINNDKIPEYAAGVGVSSAAREWATLLRERLSQMVPVVQVLSNREATAIFSQTLAIPDLLEELDDEDPSAVFASLD